MAENLEYNVNVNVDGKEDVDALAEDLATIDETTTIDIDATGVTETAEGLDSIAENTGAAGVLDDVGTAAGEAAPKAEEAASSLQNLIAGLSLVEIGGFVLDQVMARVAQNAERTAASKAFDAEQVKQFTDALRLAGDEATNLVDALDEGGEVLAQDPFGETFNLAPDLDAANISADQFFRTLQTEGVPGLERMLAASEAAGASEGTTARIRAAGIDVLGNLNTATANAATSNEVFAESQASANEALQSLLDEQDPMRRFSEEWATLVNGLRDGSIDTQSGTDALNTLAEGLNLTTDEVLSLAQAQVNEGIAGAQAYADAINGVDFGTADIRAATSAFSGYTAELFAAGNETQRIESAYAALAAAVGDGTLNLNTATEAGRAQQDALEGVAAVLDGQLAQAYDTANGSQDAFVASATKLGDETLARLQADLGLTDGQVNVLRETLGLTAADYEARFELAGVAEAQLQLGLLQGAIEGLPPEAELRVNTLIAQGEYVAARDEVAAFYAGNPVPLPAEADTEAAEGDLAAVAEEERTATITGEADTAQAATDTDAFVGQERLAHVSILIDNFAAARDTIDLAAKDRTSTVDIATGTISLPSSAELRNQIGTVRVPIQAYWNDRIEGHRPP